MRQRTVEEQTILDNIVACLEYKKLDQKDLCDFLEVSQQMFTNWKNKSSDSYLKRLPKITEFLDVTANDLMGNPNVSAPDDIAKELLLHTT